jgi:ABC-type Mn2+/Zn2+ transport system permease subunit
VIDEFRPSMLGEPVASILGDFVASWPLFHNTYVAGWLIALLLPLVGVVVVARNQIFIGAAVSQASTLGIALGMALGDWLGAGELAWLRSDAFLSVTAVICSLAAAVVTAGAGEDAAASHEALTGWVFLLSASVAILVVAHSPHGLEEIHRLVASSIIGATRADLWTFGILAALTIAAVVGLHRPLLLFAMDPAMAAAVGMPVRAWAVATSLWLGLVAGLSIRASGILYSFGCLVLPALLARSVCREVRPMFVVAPAAAVATAAAGFVLANHYDFPPGQMTVALLCALLALGWGAGHVRRAG